ncbi:MAG TPA: hypothetical protein PLL26_02770 [Candidatus Dojkabacteria bacterium]|nr:hypothetical protein [Candidatus Dojkabacteria bacterium]
MIRKEKKYEWKDYQDDSNVTDDSVGVGSVRTSGINHVLCPGRPGRSESS